MKKLFFVLCLISALGVSSMAQIVINPPSDPPVNNVVRWINIGTWPGSSTNVSFPYLHDFLGGCDLTLLPLGSIPPYGGTLSWFSLDLSAIPIENLNVSIDYCFDRPDQLSGIGNFSASFASYPNTTTSGECEYGTVPTEYTETINSSGKTGIGSVNMTNSCIPATNEGFVEVAIYVEIAWEDGNYSGMEIMYDLTLDGTPFLPAN